MAEVLRLQTNVPETIALAFVSGLPIESKFGGDQMMFSLTDERKLFVPPIVAKKIAASVLAPWEPFLLCKREIVQGNRRAVEYQVERISGEAPVLLLFRLNKILVTLYRRPRLPLRLRLLRLSFRRLLRRR